jgi:hypothetical protein
MSLAEAYINATMGGMLNISKSSGIKHGKGSGRNLDSQSPQQFTHRGQGVTSLVERFQNSNHMGPSECPHLRSEVPGLQRTRIMESIV